jgi:hypothetical protein
VTSSEAPTPADIAYNAALPESSTAAVIMVSAFDFMILLASRPCAAFQKQTCNTCARAGAGLEHQRVAGFDKRLHTAAAPQIVKEPDAAMAGAGNRSSLNGVRARYRMDIMRCATRVSAAPPAATLPCS